MDRWTESQTQWASAVTERFNTGHYVPGVSWVVGEDTATRTEQLGSTTNALEYLRQIDVAYHIEGFGAGEQLASATFDGITLAVSGTADGNGTLDGSFHIPAKVPSGAKAVTFTGKGGSRASAVFVGQGQLTVNTLRQVNTITTIWVDPLAQTFVLDKATQLAGVDLWFTAKGGDARLQIRDVANGVPTRTVLTEAHIPASSIVVSGGGHTRVLLPSPLSAGGGHRIRLRGALRRRGDGPFRRRTRQVRRHRAAVGRQPALSGRRAAFFQQRQHMDGPSGPRPDLPAAGGVLQRRVEPAGTRLGIRLRGHRPAAPLPLRNPKRRHPRRVRHGPARRGNPDRGRRQPLRLATPTTGPISVKARLAGTPKASPVLWPGTQLISGAVGLTADYATRSIPARDATKAVLVYDAVIPSGATVTPQIRKDSGEWESLTADGTTNQGDGLVEYRFKAALSNVSEVKVRLTLTGTATARPRVSNIRLMAVI